MAADGIRPRRRRLTLKNLGESDPEKHSMRCRLKRHHRGKIGTSLRAPTAIRLVDSIFFSILGKCIFLPKRAKNKRSSAKPSISCGLTYCSNNLYVMRINFPVGNSEVKGRNHQRTWPLIFIHRTIGYLGVEPTTGIMGHWWHGFQTQTCTYMALFPH